MKLITTVKLKRFESIIRVSEKVKVEKVIIEENSKRFILAHNSLVFHRKTINQLGRFRETIHTQLIIYSS